MVFILHSVIIREKILEKDFKQENTPKYPLPSADTEVSERSHKSYSGAAPEHLVRSADTEVSEPNRKLYSGDIGRILQKYLKVNIHELEKELKIMENQQVSGNLKEQTAANGGFSYPKIDRAAFVATALFFQHELKKEIQAVVDKVNADSAEFYAEHQRAVKDENGNVLGYEPAYCTIDELVKYKWHEPDNNRVFWGVDFDNVDNFGFQVYRVEQRHDELNKDFHETPEIFGNIEKNPHWKIFDDNQPYWQEIKAAFDKYYPVLWNIKKIHNPVEIYTEEQRQAAFDALNDEQKALVHQFSGSLKEQAAENGGVSLSNTQSKKDNTMNTQNTQQQNNQPDYLFKYTGLPHTLYTDTIFKFDNGYTVRISDDLEREVRSNNIEVDTWGVAMVFHKDRDMAVAEYHYYDDYDEKDGYGKSSEIWYVDEETGENDPESFEGYNVDILGNPNWKEDLARAMVDYAVSREVETGLNADKQFSGSPEIVSVVRDNYYAANRYAQNAAQNPVFLADNHNAQVMPFDDFVAAAMKDTGDSREEVIAFASEAFRSQYQAADGYLRAAIDGSIMYNAFDIEIDDKTYYATAPLEWVKEQARVGLSDRGWDLENARHNFLHSSLANNEWETAFHQLKAAADDYKQWRNQVCAFFNFRQPEITLQQGEWTQVAQFVGYNQEWEQLDNARLLIAEFTPQQALEFHGLYAQYMQYQALAENNAQQGVDTTHIDKQIATLEQSLNEKVAQNLPLTDNRQVMFDLFGTQLGLFDEETQEQGVSASKNRQPANLSLWLEENGFDFESVDSHREVFQKGNLKLAVYNDDGDYTVSLSQFDKNIPIAEIDEKMIEPTHQERIYFFQNTDDLEKLSQYLRAMEQGVSVSATPENGVETQPETVSGSPNSKFLGKEFTIDDDTFASATLIQIKSRKIDKQFTDLGYKTELEIHAIHGNHFARSISEQDFQRLAGKKGYGLFYDTSKREFVAVGGKMGERRLFEMPASQFGKEFETLLTELRNTYNIDGSKIVNSQTETVSGSPTTQEQGISVSEISETVAVSHDLSGQPETQVPVVLTKEEKSQLKAAKDALTVAKKELKAMRDELKNTRPHQVEYYLQWREETRQAISEKQEQVRELSRQYDELSFSLKTQTGEITDLEKEILTARLSGSLKERFDIAFRELKSQRKEIGVEYDELKARIDNKDFYEFEIQSVMQDAVAYYGGSRGMATLYHNGKELPLTTDRDKAIAYLLQVELPKQLHDEFGKPFNALARKISKLGNAEYYIKHGSSEWGKDIEAYIDLLEDTENQLMKGSIEERAEINLTYDINTEYGKQKIRELFYGSRHDEAQAELFERVFAMAQKLNVEVRHALRNPHTTFSKRNATTMVAGWYQLNENSARVKHGGNIQVEEKGEVLLHELVHSVTSRAMLLKEQGHTELLNPAQIKAIDEIEKIYQAVLGKAEELGFEKYQTVSKNGVETYQGDYGLKNSHEFIAELSNPVFREKLKQVAMFDDTVKAVTCVATGVEKTETAYDRLTAALYQIMDNYDPDFGTKYEQAKYGNIKMNDLNTLPESDFVQAVDDIGVKNTDELMGYFKGSEVTLERGRALWEVFAKTGDKQLGEDLKEFVRTTKTLLRAIEKFEEIKQTRPLTREDYQRMNTIARPNEKIVSELSSSKYADNTEIERLNAVYCLEREQAYLKTLSPDDRNYKPTQNAIAWYEKEVKEWSERQAALQGGVSLPENSVKQDAFGLPEKDNQMEQTIQTADKGGIVMAEPVLAGKTAQEMKEIINDLLQQRSEQMGNKHLSSDIATLMVYVRTDNPTAEETQAVKDLGVVKNFVENNMQYKKWYAPTPQDEIRRLQKKIDANFELQREYLAMGDEKGANAITVQIATLQEKQQSLGLQLPDNTVKHDLNNQPETVKTLNPKEQALEDGKRLNQAAEKVKNAQWECAKKPNDKECYDNLKAALAEQAALNEKIKPRVQTAMDSGKPYIVEYTEDGKPLELVVTQTGTLRPALGSYDKEPKHNHLLCTINGEVALNAEQRSTPERVAEVLKDNFNDKNSDISDKLAIINYPNADKVFSEDQIKDTLNKALKSSFKEHRLAAIKSPVMRGEWLAKLSTSQQAPEELRHAAKNEMAERYGTPEPTVEQTAEKSGFSSPEHEEELATVAADDGYERD